MKNTNSNEFDKKATTWDENPNRLDLAKAVAKCISQRIPNSTSLTALDYGCGTGLISFLLDKNFKKIILVDSSKEMLKKAEEKLKQSDLKNISIMQLDLENLNETHKLKNIDVIYSSMVMHHIKNIKNMFDKFYSYLKPNGILIIADLDKEDGTFHEKNFDGHNGFEQKQFSDILKICKFSNIIFKNAHTIKKICNDGSEKTFSVFIMSCQKN